jgi:hypothetical protein
MMLSPKANDMPRLLTAKQTSIVVFMAVWPNYRQFMEIEMRGCA